jgi:hypothetical protein
MRKRRVGVTARSRLVVGNQAIGTPQAATEIAAPLVSRTPMGTGATAPHECGWKHGDTTGVTDNRAANRLGEMERLGNPTGDSALARRKGRRRGVEGQRGTKPAVSSPFGIPLLPSASEPTSRIHESLVIPPEPPVADRSAPQRCSPARVRSAAPKTGAPLPTPRRCGADLSATGGSGGITRLRPLYFQNTTPWRCARLPPVGGRASQTSEEPT